jgi:DNA primase
LLFKCFGCNASGNVLAFTARMEHIDTGDAKKDAREAALRLAEWFGITTASAKGNGASPAPVDTGNGSTTDAGEDSQRTRDEEVAPVNPPLTFTFKSLDQGHAYLTERGLTPETVATFGLGYHAGNGMMHGRIVIPIHNEQGELVAYAGRFPGIPPEGTPKYLFPPNFHKSLVLFNLHRAKENIKDGLIVTEGFFDTIELWQKGRKNVVAIMGSSLSPEQERLIVETVGPKGRVLLAFDQDDAGRRGMAEAAERLTTKVFVRTVALG